MRAQLARLSRRVPTVLQLTDTECGAACLAMVLGYHGRPTTVSEVRDLCAIGRDGASAATLTEAARALGLRATGYTTEPDGLRFIECPAILHWDFRHFIVLERWSLRGAVIVDPAFGRRRATRDDMDKHFTGVVLTFEPEAGFATRPRAARPALGPYLCSLLCAPRIRPALARIFTVSLALQIVSLALAGLTRLVVDEILPFGMHDLMRLLPAGVAVAVLTFALASYLRAIAIVQLEARLDARMMLGFFERLLSLPFGFFQSRTTGDLALRLSSNLMIREALANQTTAAILDGCAAVASFAMVLGMSPAFGAVVAGLAVAQTLTVSLSAGGLRELSERELQAAAESQGYLVEALNGIETLKACGTEDTALKHWTNLFNAHMNASVERGRATAVVDTVVAAFRLGTPMLLLWFGALQVLDGRMSVGTMLAANALAASVLVPVSSLVGTLQRMLLVRAHLERLADVLNAEPERSGGVRLAEGGSRGAIELRSVTFAYDPGGPAILKDLSLRIRPGQKVAIVGRTGSGKSTLARLLLGLYRATAGEVLLDGRPVEHWHLPSLRRAFGVVLQEPFIFSGSIRQNIAFHDPSMPAEQVEEAARLAGIHDDITGMSMGYETRLAEGGSDLSGGQRQRLALARAVAHRPAVLLLDEATSHLDAVTERGVDERLSLLSCTRIVVAHRLSTVRNADVIVVLDAGRIVECGRHEDLLARGGHYAALVHSQSDAGWAPALNGSDPLVPARLRLA